MADAQASSLGLVAIGVDFIFLDGRGSASLSQRYNSTKVARSRNIVWSFSRTGISTLYAHLACLFCLDSIAAYGAFHIPAVPKSEAR